MPFPFIYTFYSYKGGVGRSMALMNVAYQLAAWGRNVLMVDMDLEAPGLSRSKEFDQRGQPPRDVVDLLAAAIQQLQHSPPSPEIASQLPPLDSFIRTISDAHIQPMTPRVGKLGKLGLLGADLERGYHERSSALRLKDFSGERLIHLSTLLHHYFKAHRFDCRPFWREEFEVLDPVTYDFILVDSRTGITELGGLCVGPLSDRLVILTGLNDQNIDGTLEVLKEVGIIPQARGNSDEPWDDRDGLSSPSLGPKPTIVVASPVPVQEMALRKQRLATLKDKLGIDAIELPYHSLLALEETVFVRDYQTEHLAAKYQELTTAVLALVGDDPTTLRRRAVSAISKEDLPFTAGLAAAARLAPSDPNVGWGVMAALLEKLNKAGAPETPEIRQTCAFLAQEPEMRAYGLLNWAIHLMILARNSTGEEADRWFGAAYQKFAAAIEINSNDYYCLYNWGSALVTQGRRKSGGEASRLLEEAQNKLARVHELKPDFAPALDAWGMALLSVELVNEATEKLLSAEKLQPGISSVTLARIAARARDKQAMLDWLAKASPRPTRILLSKSAEFEPFGNDPDLLAFLESLPEPPQP